MKFLQTPDAFGMTPARRIGFAAAGTAAGGILCAAVLALFALSSATPWLPGSPEAMAQFQACQQRPQRTAQQACVREVVAQRQANERRQVNVASKR